jgi:iron complex transport system substrate-binding protein
MTAGLRALLICITVAAAANGCGEPDRGPAGLLTPPGEPARRIISLAPHLTELVYSAGAGHLLVGVVEFSDFPPAARTLPRIGDAFRVDYERIGRLDPDLILVWPSGNPKELVNRLRGLGYRVVGLEPSRLDAIAASLVEIGKLTGTEDVAFAAAAEFRREVDELRNRYANSDRLRVFYQIAEVPYFTVNGKHVIGEIIELCGGRNVFADVDNLAPPVTLEAILAADPEVIIVSLAPNGQADGSSGSWRNTWDRWQNLAAVRAGNLFTVRADLVSRSSTRIIEGARQICQQLEAARTGA